MWGFGSKVLSEGDHRGRWRSGTFPGDGGVLPYIDIRPQYNMGRYRVDIGIFGCLFDSQPQFDSEVDVFLVNEIGIIGPWSSTFVSAMDSRFESPHKVDAAISVSGNNYVQQVKNRLDVGLCEVTNENRDQPLD